MPKNARAALKSVFGYPKTDKDLKKEAKEEAKALLERVKDKSASVKLKSGNAAKLLPGLKVVAGGRGGLEAGSRKAAELAETLNQAAAEAEKAATKIGKLVDEHPESKKELPVFKDQADKLVVAIQEQVRGPKRLADAFAAALPLCDSLTTLDARLKAGLGFRLKALRVAKGGNVVTPLETEQESIAALLESASNDNSGAEFKPDRLRTAISSASERVTALEKAVAKAEAGEDGPKKTVIAGACISQYDLHVRTFDLSGAVTEALSRLQETDRKVAWRHLSSLLVPFDEARNGFLSALKSAEDAPAMNQVLQEHLAAYDRLVKAFRDKLNSSEGFAEIADVAKTAQNDEKSEIEFASLLDQGEDKIALLYAMGSTRTKSSKDALWSLQVAVSKETGPDRYAVGVVKMKTLLGEIDAAIEEQKKAAAKVIEQAKARRAQLAEMMKNAKKDVPEETMTALEGRLSVIDNLVEGDNAQAAAAVVDLINEAYAILNDALAEDGDTKTFDRLAGEYKTAFGKLPTDMLGSGWEADLKARRGEFQKELTTIVEDADRLKIGPDLAKVKALGNRWDRMLEQFTKLKAWQLETARRIAALETDLADLDKTLKAKRGKPYQGTARADIADIKGRYQTPKADRGSIEQKLAEMEKAIAAYKDGSGLDIISGVDMKTALMRDEELQKENEDEAREEEAERQRKLTEWRKTKDADFKKKYAETETVVKTAKGDLAALRKVKELYEKAKAQAEQLDFETADQELESCLAQLKDLKDFPQGIGQKSRANLVALAEDWLKQSKVLGERISAIGKAAKTRGDGKIAAEQLTEITDRIDVLAAQITGQCTAAGEVFKASFETLKTAKNQDERLKAREEALRSVRQIRSVLRLDPLLQLVAGNPFTAVDLQSPMEKTLIDIELNATIAV